MCLCGCVCMRMHGYDYTPRKAFLPKIWPSLVFDLSDRPFFGFFLQKFFVFSFRFFFFSFSLRQNRDRLHQAFTVNQVKGYAYTVTVKIYPRSTKCAKIVCRKLLKMSDLRCRIEANASFACVCFVLLTKWKQMLTFCLPNA